MCTPKKSLAPATLICTDGKNIRMHKSRRVLLHFFALSVLHKALRPPDSSEAIHFRHILSQGQGRILKVLCLNNILCS